MAFCYLLFSVGIKQLPHTDEQMAEKQEELIAKVIDADFVHAKEASMEEIDPTVHDLFNTNRTEVSRDFEFQYREKYFYILKRDINNIKPRIRRNILQVVLRCLRFEAMRAVQKMFSSRRTHDDIRNDIILKKIRVEQFTKLAKCCGPVMLKLPWKYDSRKNRIKAFTLILWSLDPRFMYRFDKKNEEFKNVVTCHDNCTCGWGSFDQEKIKSFRVSQIKATLRNSSYTICSRRSISKS